MSCWLLGTSIQEEYLKKNQREWMRTVRFDKFAGSKFERTKCGPQGGGQEARSNPLAPTIYYRDEGLGTRKTSIS